MLLPFVRDFTDRVRRGARLELVLTLCMGITALAMAGAGKNAFAGEHRTGPAERPVREPVSHDQVPALVARLAPVARITVASLPPARNSPARAVAERPLPPHRDPIRAALRVRGPPRPDLTA